MGLHKIQLLFSHPELPDNKNVFTTKTQKKKKRKIFGTTVTVTDADKLSFQHHKRHWDSLWESSSCKNDNN